MKYISGVRKMYSYYIIYILIIDELNNTLLKYPFCDVAHQEHSFLNRYNMLYWHVFASSFGMRVLRRNS